MHASIVFNPNAGATPAQHTRAEVRVARRILQEHGVRTSAHSTQGGLEQALQRALERRPDILVAAGGDGTVSAIADQAVRQELAFGVLPMGTLNHFARDVGIPMKTAPAARLIARARPRRIDVASVNGRHFLNNSSIGAYPRIVERREELRDRHGHGKWTAMARAGLQVLRRHPMLSVGIETPTGRVVRRTSFVFIGNNPYEMRFFALGRRSRLDTGRLSLYFSNHQKRRAALRLAARSVIGRLDQDRDFIAQTPTAVTLETPRHHLRVAIDGEVRRMRPPLHYRSHPRRLRLLAPRPPRRRRP